MISLCEFTYLYRFCFCEKHSQAGSIILAFQLINSQMRRMVILTQQRKKLVFKSKSYNIIENVHNYNSIRFVVKMWFLCKK